MTGKFITTNTNLEVRTTNIQVVEIGDLSFEMDERFPWVDIYLIGDEGRAEFLERIDEEEVLVGLEELRIFALNWYFKNVEVVNK
ncbi:ubiquitin [Clostridium perfringens]|nr:ubiquitin [Clostridium perfringens]